MRSEIRRCAGCGRYTLEQECPACGSATSCPVPPRYSPEDRMGKYRRISILQEMENLDGILIATTNLTQNLDPAFERRFLYKICFEKPDASVREKIWHTMLPTLSEEQCALLASAYNLSGGQMENVARKFSINSILYGSEKSPMDILHAYCNAERLDNQPTRRIGF